MGISLSLFAITRKVMKRLMIFYVGRASSIKEAIKFWERSVSYSGPPEMHPIGDQCLQLLSGVHFVFD